MTNHMHPKTIAPHITNFVDNQALMLDGPACHDCNAEVEAFINGPIVAVNVMHEGTCPTYRKRVTK
ncbi:hypothetical protein [Arthrobacter antibioticus]|uniref:hypothetical protein n=1 Tax=Arthrobacter sp. H35-MC1 TaxID=3046203 RepID=UPI0024B98F15|nr:hypothetical protein [Arthrobacter sp. H35-MC1]MDJ0317854.1 hypothetical protein [Arthrobacter sp. H35-MC1]